MAENYLYALQPLPSNPIRVLLAKMLRASAGSSAVGGGGVSQGHGAPVANPSNVNIPWIYTDLDTGTTYVWNVETAAWI